ncbi:Restriction modification system DNA specificity domain protein [uncultured Dysgonomonas sp.]|uniref:Restriction modification system DNA specificity domain protein n=2 Tax=uncultured Dysgonomonas sp. TaxID=206096 RepID=A0A212JTI2_9BACT|nr:Restriction modification system DNA specificity domain protein [uncultured Dysgonomonas sp.]
MIYTAKFSFMKEWKKYKLGELITLKYGKDHKKLNDGSFPVYGSGGVMRYGNDYIYDDSSILIPRKGSLNNIMFVDKPFWTVDTMFWSIIDQELVLPRFLYYTLCKYDFAGLNVGSAVPSLTVPVIESIEVVIPSIEKQKRILSLLVPLDDKIALNQRINDNLEQQAQALYKSWFVDFEPFKGEKFVDSELGKIPEGWRVGKIGNYCKVRSGYAFKSSWWTDKGCKVIKIKNITEESKLDLNNCSHVLKSNTIKASDFMVSAGDVLIAMTGATIGKFCIVPYLQNNTYVNQRVGKFFLGNDPIKKLPFLYNTLKQGKVLSEIISKGQGSAQPNISGLDIENISIIQPTNELIQSFNALLIPLYLLMLKNEQENIVLANKRDSLLPKLMSGELKTGDLHR